jgi:hypothetical protein
VESPRDQGTEDGIAKVLRWLDEESCQPQTVADPSLRFKIKFKVEKWVVYVGQSLQAKDSIVVWLNVGLSPEEANLAYRQFKEQRQRDFLTELRYELIYSGKVGSFMMKFDNQNRYQSIDLLSKPLFYETLTKEKLVYAYMNLLDALNLTVMLLGKHWDYYPPGYFSTRAPPR